MPKPPFKVIWNRIVNHKGEMFHTIKRLPFIYEIKGNALYPSRTRYQISRSDFEKAYSIVPIDGPGVVNNIVRGPAYVWAILHDDRISLREW